MKSRYNDQIRLENERNTYKHDIDNDQPQKKSISFSTNDKNKIVGKFAAGVAYEIENPLTSIKEVVQQLKSIEVSKPEYYSIMYSEINKVEKIVNRLIKLGETQSVNFCINNIELILERAIMRINDLALVKDIKIISSLEGERVSIYCDPVKLQHVFENIIKNAIEASTYNEIVYITCKTTEDHVHIMIKDQAAGIPEDRFSHLFEPFYYIKDSSTGLGLMISHKVIKEHNGTIQVESELEKGTTVNIYLPSLNS
ncbi:ATP-binding protein [Sporosarcina siberiensis]|uniref:histidine kinase n=1 Tax=Sporosarcina siberiensis TaxID=1365606 RepID=A0ABW4SEF9_9BACL